MTSPLRSDIPPGRRPTEGRQNIYCFLKWIWAAISKDVLTLLFAALSVLFAALSVLLGALAWRTSKITLAYMRGRDLELDDRNGWIELHKAMINLRVQREYVLLPMKMAALGMPSPIQAADSIKDYTLAAAQLRSQLDRLNDDSLIVELATFLDDNGMTAQWQAEAYAPKFDEFVHKVAFKSRPK